MTKENAHSAMILVAGAVIILLGIFWKGNVEDGLYLIGAVVCLMIISIRKLN